VNLERFGFTPTESKAYASLVRHGPSTGYALARAIGVARANAYQALDSLVRRGAARRASTIPAQYSAVPPGVLIASLGRVFQRDLEALEEGLRAIAPAESAAAAAPLAVTDVDVLLDNAAEVCRAAREELMVVMGPWASSLIAPIAIARARAANVRVIALGEPAPDGAVIRPVPLAETRGYWGGLPVVACADGMHVACGVIGDAGGASGIMASSLGLAPFLRHLVRREFGATRE
jgi:sugar-specific transcriptional regulator TrmB